MKNEAFETWKTMCAEFVKGGGNEALFWAGRLSMSARWLLDGPIESMGDHIALLRLTVSEYDRVIMDLCRKKLNERHG